jgi:hypothetical protein
VKKMQAAAESVSGAPTTYLAYFGVRSQLPEQRLAALAAWVDSEHCPLSIHFRMYGRPLRGMTTGNRGTPVDDLKQN